MRTIFIISFVLMIVGCSKEPIDGTAYVVRGDGDITRAAAVDVYALPFDSVDEFLEALSQSNKKTNESALQSYISQACGTLPAAKSVVLEEKRTLSDKFSDGCRLEQDFVSELKTEKKDPTSLKNQIREQEAKLARVVQKETSAIKQAMASQVKVSYDYYAGDWGEVTVKNGSPYWIKPGIADTVDGFVKGIPVLSFFPSPTIGPGKSWSSSFGSSSSSGVGSKLINNGSAKICRENQYNMHVPCLESFGPKEYNSSADENYVLGEWKFATRHAEKSIVETKYTFKEVDFESLARKRNAVRTIAAELDSLRSDLEDSSKKFNNLNLCESVTSQISEVNALDCPAPGADRSSVEGFIEKALSLNIKVPDLPAKQNGTVASFARSNAFAKTTTNVEGKFSLEAPSDGNFLIYSSYVDRFISVEWLVPVKSDDKVLELNNGNAL